jgi:signal transduction histidine kinase
MKLSVQHLLSAYKDNAPNLAALTEKILNTVLKQIDILNTTATEFSKFAKMPGFTPNPINITTLISEVKDLYTGSPLSFVFTSSLTEVNIMGDESYFKRAVINLVKNAIQAGATEVIVNLDLSEQGYILLISDNGKGIPPEIREKIFDINFTTKATGTGLGLKLTRRFVESVAGTMELLDKQPGTYFKIIFPKIEKKIID